MIYIAERTNRRQLKSRHTDLTVDTFGPVEVMTDRSHKSEASPRPLQSQKYVDIFILIHVARDILNSLSIKESTSKSNTLHQSAN